VVGVVGGTVILIGVALTVLPGPAFVVIPLGFAILAIEFAWARRWLRRLKGMIRKTTTHRKSPITYMRTRFDRWRSMRRRKREAAGTGRPNDPLVEQSRQPGASRSGPSR